MRRSCRYRRPLLEPEPVGEGVDGHGVTFDEFAFEDPPRQGVEHTPLKRPLEWSRAVGGVVSFAHELLLGRVGSCAFSVYLLRFIANHPNPRAKDGSGHDCSRLSNGGARLAALGVAQCVRAMP